MYWYPNLGPLQVDVDEDPAEVKKDEQQDVNSEEVLCWICRFQFYWHFVSIQVLY